MSGLTARWCDAAIFNGIVFLAGHVPEQTEGGPLAEQTAEVLALLEDTLAQAGSSKERILSVQIFLAIGQPAELILEADERGARFISACPCLDTSRTEAFDLGVGRFSA